MLVLSLIVLCALAGVLLMGPGRGRGGLGGGAGGPRKGASGFTLGQLLQNPSVQDELKLTDAQKQSVRQVVQEVRGRFREQFQALGQLNGPAKRKKGQELARTISAEIRTSLTDTLAAEQRARLRQIELQCKGAEVFEDPEVRSALGLTEAQHEQIRTLVESARRDLRDPSRSPGAGDAPSRIPALRKQVMERAASALTAEQARAWKELLGAPFDLKFEPRPGGWPGPAPAGEEQTPFLLEFEDDL